MDELVRQLASKAGGDDAIAERSVGIVQGFLRNEGPPDKEEGLIDRTPEAETIASPSSGALLATLAGGGRRAVGTPLTSLGLPIHEIQNIARELFDFRRDKIGADPRGEIIVGTPGLSQFA